MKPKISIDTTFSSRRRTVQLKIHQVAAIGTIAATIIERLGDISDKLEVIKLVPKHPSGYNQMVEVSATFDISFDSEKLTTRREFCPSSKAWFSEEGLADEISSFVDEFIGHVHEDVRSVARGHRKEAAYLEKLVA